jgi:hypothetical protein
MFKVSQPQRSRQVSSINTAGGSRVRETVGKESATVQGKDSAQAGHDFGRISTLHTSHAHRQPARGLTRDGSVEFQGIPSPQLFAHELVHVAQQRLGRGGVATASRSGLEQEAEMLAPRLAAGQAVDVRHAAPRGVALAGTDPDKTYTSTVGLETDDKYIKAAHDYHQKWGYNPISVASVEAITDDLAKGTGTLSRIRIVSHASQIGLFMQFATGSPITVMEEELRATTQKEAEQTGVVEVGDYTNDSAKETFRDAVVQKDGELAKRLKITKDKIDDDNVRSFFIWLLNRHRTKNVPGPSQADRDLILPAIDRQVSAASKVAEAGGTASKADLTSLESIVSGYGFSWSAMTPGDQLQDVFDRAKATHEAFTSRDFAKKQTQMRARFTKDSTVEIRGCALGQTQSYMEGVQNYFGSAAGKPAVTAPDWYQYFGTIGLYLAPSSDAAIQKHWSGWKHSKDLQDNFKKWAPTYAPTQKIPANPTWSDFATYLRAGHALPYLNGSRLFTLKDMTEDQVIDWFTKNDQRLTSAGAIKNQFTGKKVSDEATSGNIFEWLQENYTDTPKSRLFPYDPQWKTHFKAVPGV